MSKHTPGPWEWVPYYDEQRYLAASQRVDNSPTWDCAVLAADGAEGDLYIRIREADARLIASAPDLLELLEEALFLVRFIPSVHGNLCDRIKSAIAKAKGPQ